MATTTTFNGKKVHQGMIKSQKTRVGDFIIAFIIFLTMLICLLPMVNVLASSLSSSEHLIRNDVFLWPKGWNFEAYKTILSDSKYTWSLAWTGILTVVCTVLSLVLTVCTAFPLIYKNLRGGKVINFIILFTMYFSAGTIPGYILLNNLKMLNTPWALILPNCISVFNVIVLRSFFYSVPDSLREAAEIDGAGPIRTLVTVYLPLSGDAGAVLRRRPLERLLRCADVPEIQQGGKVLADSAAAVQHHQKLHAKQRNRHAGRFLQRRRFQDDSDGVRHVCNRADSAGVPVAAALFRHRRHDWRSQGLMPLYYFQMRMHQGASRWCR